MTESARQNSLPISRRHCLVINDSNGMGLPDGRRCLLTSKGHPTEIVLVF